LQGQAIGCQPSTSQIVAAATNQSVSNDSKTTIMLAAKKKQIEIHNKLLFPNINKENSSS
jgi:hypothetical protein